MKKLIIRGLWYALVPLVALACTSTSTSRLISIEDHSFARTNENGELVTMESPAAYKAGETVHLILMNVGPFKKDSLGLNWFDMDMTITGPGDREIVSANNMLGEEGHINLPNNHAASPYASYENTSDLAPGTYQFTIIIYDKIGTGKAKMTAKFIIE